MPPTARVPSDHSPSVPPPNASDRRTHSLEGVEREVYIDPARNIDEVVGGVPESGGKTKGPPPKGSVLFETAGGLGAKLRNTHQVGGERVKGR